MSRIIKLKDKYFKPYLESSAILQRVGELAEEINRDYAEKHPIFLAVLNGSFMFASDLFKELFIDCDISFIKYASYQGTGSTGKVTNLIGLNEELQDRHVILLEDIVDTGNTLAEIIPLVKTKSPASVKIGSLLVKPEALRHDIIVNYVGFKIPNDFIVGYGLDYDGYGRNLKDIYQITDAAHED